MKIVHTMIRVNNLDESIKFYCDALGMKLLKKRDYESGRFTNAFVGYGSEETDAVIELTYNWDPEALSGARNFGHLAYEVPDIYAACARLRDGGVTINRPPRDGRMAFVRSPDGISIELLQAGEALPPTEPWASMPNVGTW